MNNQYNINFFDFLNCLTNITDWIIPQLGNHHKQVALISLRLAEELNISPQEQKHLLNAAILHDIGAISLKERLATLNFENTGGQAHAEAGYYLLKDFEPATQAAKIIRYHHTPWKTSDIELNKQVPFASRILFLADHISLMLNKKENVLKQSHNIIKRIFSSNDNLFEPNSLRAFLNLAEKEAFWLDIVSPLIDNQLKAFASNNLLLLDKDLLLEFANVFRKIIDFRNPFTATHSSGVSASAHFLGNVAGLCPHTCFELKAAGYIHDLGKMAVPVSILESENKLTNEEFNQMRSHTFYTYRVLEPMKDLERINKYGAYHHERIDGTGYPFKLKDKELPFGSKVLAVADVFTALMEDRPYRKGMKLENALNIIQKMGENKKLDLQITSLLENCADELNETRIKAQTDSRTEYNKLVDVLNESREDIQHSEPLKPAPEVNK